MSKEKVQMPDWLATNVTKREPAPYWKTGLTQDIAKAIYDERELSSVSELAFELHCIEGYSRKELYNVLGINTASTSMIVNKLKPGQDNLRYERYLEAIKENFGELKAGQKWIENFFK